MRRSKIVIEDSYSLLAMMYSLVLATPTLVVLCMDSY